MTLSLSTMWAQQPRFVEDMHVFVQEARDLGYDAIEVSHLTTLAPFERLLEDKTARISSIHAPAPLVRTALERANSALNLAAIDEDERREAVGFTKRSIDLAKQVGAGFVVVHLGALGDGMFPEEKELRRLYDSGTREGERVEELRAACLRKREDEGGPWLEQGLVSMREIVDHGQLQGVAVGLENRLHFHEIPSPSETELMLAGFPPEDAGYWHDVGHAEVQHRLGLTDKRSWLDINGARCLGAHLHDVDGIGDHRAPGEGDVQWDYIAEGMPADALRVFEINQHTPPAAVAGAIAFLRERGVIE